MERRTRRREKEEIRTAAKEAEMMPDEYVLSKLKPGTADQCREYFQDADELMSFLDQSVEARFMSVAEAQIIWEAHKEDEIKAAKEKLESAPKFDKLSTVLRGVAPASVLEHCDTVMGNKVLLETYLMQCINNGKIDRKTADFLQGEYTKAREKTLKAHAENVSVQKNSAQPVKQEVDTTVNQVEIRKDMTIDAGVGDDQENEIFMTRRGGSKGKQRSWICPECETTNTENECILCGYRNTRR